MIHCSENGLPVAAPLPGWACGVLAASGLFFFATTGLAGIDAAWAGAIVDANKVPMPTAIATRHTQGDLPDALFQSKRMTRFDLATSVA